MSEFLLLVVLGLAVARLTRLWRDDTITEGLRDRVFDRLDPDGKLAELLACPWCLGGWLSILAVVAVDSATSRSIPVPWLSWLAVWMVANLTYWLCEAVADADTILWDERKKRKID